MATSGSAGARPAESTYDHAIVPLPDGERRPTTVRPDLPRTRAYTVQTTLLVTRSRSRSKNVLGSSKRAVVVGSGRPHGVTSTIARRPVSAFQSARSIS